MNSAPEIEPNELREKCDSHGGEFCERGGRLCSRCRAAEEIERLQSRLAAAEAQIEAWAAELEADRIISGSFGPLMDAGYSMACKHWAERLRSALSASPPQSSENRAAAGRGGEES